MLSITQLIGLAENAGFSGDDLSTAVAIALAESGGNPQAYNPEVSARAPQGKGSFGLWQIYLGAHPEFASENLFDPQTNADAAFAVYRSAGSSFRPWTTYTGGQYLANVDQVNQILDASQPAPVFASADSGSAAAPAAGLSSFALIGLAIVAGFLLWSVG